ncbi:MAG: cyclase family protein [Tepidiformaceae bacterium]
MVESAPNIAELFRDGPKNWGRWGETDEVGSLNFLDGAQVLRGARAMVTGETYALGLEILRPGGDPAIATRGQVKKFMSSDHGIISNGHVSPMAGDQWYADDAVFMFLQASSHIDALGHVWYDDTLYNGYPASSTTGGLKHASIKPVADHGVVGRGVLIDVAGYRKVESLGDNETVPFRELMEIAASQHVEFQPHDIILLRTGRVSLFYREGLDSFLSVGQPGITDERELIEWFHRMEIPALGSDTVTGEQSVSSISGARLPLHAALLTNLGIPFMELLWLDDLAAACAKDGRYDFFFAASPLKIHGATGSPINPLAIR